MFGFKSNSRPKPNYSKVPQGFTVQGVAPDGTIDATTPLVNHTTGKVIGTETLIVSPKGDTSYTQSWLYPEKGSATGLSTSGSDADAAAKASQGLGKKPDPIPKPVIAASPAVSTPPKSFQPQGYQQEPHKADVKLTTTEINGSTPTLTDAHNRVEPIYHGGISGSTLASNHSGGSDTSGLDPKLSWIITDDKGHTFTTKVGNKNDFTFADNGDLLEKRPGGNWYVAKDNSPGNSTSNLASEHGKDMGFITDNSPGSSPQKQSVAPDIIDRYVASHPEPSDALDRAVANHTNDTTVNTHTDVLDRAVSNLSASSTWHANAAWAAPTSEGKTAISQIAPSLNTDDVLEARSGEHGNYLLRMKDGTYKSIDLASGGVSGAGTWDSSQWSGSSYSNSGHGGPVSGTDTNIPTGSVGTPSGVYPQPKTDAEVVGPVAITNPKSEPLDPAIQSAINQHSSNISDSLSTVTVAPNLKAAPLDSAISSAMNQHTVTADLTYKPAANTGYDVGGAILESHPASPTIDMTVPNHRFEVAQAKANEPFTLPGVKPEDAINTTGFDPPGNDFHLKHNRIME